jgi:hypothetical protein
MSKRADRRIDFHPPVCAVIKTVDRVYNALLTDISSSGLRFQSREHFKKGEKIIFEPKNDEHIDLPASIKAIVKNEYGKTEHDHYVYGAKIPRLSHWYERNRIHTFIYSEIKRREKDQ